MSVPASSVAPDRIDPDLRRTEAGPMVIDCERCEVRGLACGDCVIGVLLGVPGVPAAVPDEAVRVAAVRD